MQAGPLSKNALSKIIAFFLALGFMPVALAQFEINGQYIARTEYRNGYGNLIARDTSAAAFISSRARIGASYKTDIFSFHMSLQDVRTFGNSSQLKTTDPYLSVYEAWGEVKLDSSWFLKIGRQELVYDNARFLGNVDWTLQGRTHDFILLKYEKNAFKIHAGGTYNQDSEKLTGNIFYTSNQYKTAQLLRAEYKLKKFDFSVLCWNDGRQYTVKDSVGKITQKGIRYMQTVGLPTIRFKTGNLTVSAFYYHQLGKDVKNRTVNAYDASAQVSYTVKLNEERKSQIVITAGAEILSGTEKGSSENNSYSPLYGTNHMHNGYLDYFYVGGRHENSVGLNDGFVRCKYDVNKKLFFSLNGHYFAANTKVKDSENKNMNKYLGCEADFSTGFILRDYLSLQAGYSQMFSSSTLQTLRGVNKPQDMQHWAYLMLIFKTKNNKPFIGLST